MTDPRWQTVREGYYERAEMRWMSVEDAIIEVPARWLAEQGREIERLREALRDYAERGVRADLNPTRKIPTPDSFWLSYLERIDRQVRDRARATLGGEE